MPKFVCKVGDSNGGTYTSTYEAQSLPELAARFEAQGITVEEAKEFPEDIPQVRSIPYFEITALYRQIASSISAGLPIVETLDLLSTESRNVRLKTLLRFMRSKVSDGEQLSAAMAAIPRAFPRVHTAAVRAGEESGSLDVALNELARQAESFSNMNRRFASALVYPATIALAALGLFSFGFLSIVPRFRTMFGDLGVMQYPPMTRFVFFLSDKFPLIVCLLLLSTVILCSIVIAQRKAAAGRLLLDTWKLRIPVVGQILEKSALARFTGTLGLLLESGVALPKAIWLASEGAGNKTVEQLLKNLSTEVELGCSLSDAIANADAMPPTLAWRIGVGEETGNLGDALCQLSRLYSNQVESLMISLSGLIEPVLIIVLGSGVALLVMGMFLPLAGIIQSLSGCSS